MSNSVNSAQQMFNIYRNKLPLGIAKAESRLQSLESSRYVLPTVHLSPKRKRQKALHLDDDQEEIQNQLQKKIYMDDGEGPGLAIRTTEGFAENVKPILCSSSTYENTRTIMAAVFPTLSFHQNSLIVLEGVATKRLFVYLSNMRKMPYTICCTQSLHFFIDGKKLSMHCQGCKSHILDIKLKGLLTNFQSFSELDKIRLSNLVNSGRYCRANILQSIKEHVNQPHHQYLTVKMPSIDKQRKKRLVSNNDQRNKSSI